MSRSLTARLEAVVQDPSAESLPSWALDVLLDAAVQAPSGDNLQPWAFSRSDAGHLRLSIDPERDTSPINHRQWASRIALGAALENMLRTSELNGWTATGRESSDWNHIDLTWEGVPPEPDQVLGDPLIYRRTTNRRRYQGGPVSGEVIGKLKAAVSEWEGMRVFWITDPERLSSIATLVGRADRLLFSRQFARDTISANIRFDVGRRKTADRALCPACLEASGPQLWCLKALRHLPSFLASSVAARLVGSHSRRLARSSSGFCLVVAPDRSARSDVLTGRVLQRAWLALTEAGLAAQPMTSLLIGSLLSLIEQKPDRAGEKLEAETRKCFPEIGNGYLTFLLRFGFADPPTMRSGRMPWRASATAIEAFPRERISLNSRPAFSYQEAFRRNIGLVSETEQELLRRKTVAIPGLGGVGGQHLITLARMGVGGFHIADADTFSLANFNRQHGANLLTLGKNKAEVMEGMARAINPELRLRVSKEFITERNIDQFLAGCDLVVDSLDAFALEDRRTLYNASLSRGIPIIAAGPLGFSASMVIFLPGGMSFDQYFDYDPGSPPSRNFLKFLLGTAPRPHFLKYLNMERVDQKEKNGPCSAASINLCAGVAAIEALKLLLGRGRVFPVPHYHYLDPYLMKFKIGYLRKGNRGLIQRALFQLARRRTGLG